MDSIKDRLKKFFRKYRQYYIRKQRAEYGKDAYIPDHSFEEFLDEIRDAIKNMSSGTHTGRMKFKVSLSVKISYGKLRLFNEEKDDEVVDSISLPIIVADGTCGLKHILISNGDYGMNLGPAMFRNKSSKKGDAN